MSSLRRKQPIGKLNARMNASDCEYATFEFLVKLEGKSLARDLGILHSVTASEHKALNLTGFWLR